jgi:magnesium transporter
MTTNKHVRKSNATVKKRRNSLLYENLVYSGSSDVQTNIQNVCYDKDSIKVSHFENTKDLIASLEKTKVNWIHISGLNNVDIIGELCQAFGLQIPAIQDILNVRHIAKIEETNGVLLAILDGYAYDESQNLNREHLGFVLGNHFVISFEETRSSRFDLVVKALESKTGQVRTQKTDYLFNLLINIVVDSYLEVLEFHQNGLMEMEDMLMEFNADHKESGQSIQHFR